MPDPIFAAVLGIFGVAISATVSWFVSAYQVKAGLQKIRLEMQRVYAEKLLDARLKKFEAAYTAIERMAKAIQRREVQYQDFKAFCSLLDEWHSSNGLVLSSATNGKFYTQLRTFNRIAERSEAAFSERLADHPKRRDLIRDLWALELALKNDLGVFEVEFFDPGKRFTSYQEIDSANAAEYGKGRKTDA